MKQQILLLSSNPYSMKDDNGRINEGLSIRYLADADLSPVVNDDTSHSLGQRVAKASLPLKMKSDMPFAPAIYEVDLGLKIASDGKTSVTFNDISFVSCIQSVPYDPYSNDKKAK